MELKFDADKHEYRIAGTVVPSVTQVLDDVVPGWHAEEYHLGLGSANHAVYAMLGRATAFNCDPVCEPYAATWMKWGSENLVTILATETMVASELLQYAGTSDAIANVAWFDGLVLVDYKAHLTHAVRWQLALYSMALEQTTKTRIKARLGVEIRPDGYKMEWRKGKDMLRDNNEALAILTAYRCRRQAGIKERNEK